MGSPGTSVFTLPADPAPVDGPVIGPQPRIITNAPQELSHRHPPVEVFIETEAGSNVFRPARINWQRITRAMDGGDNTATLSTGLDAERLSGAGEIGEEHFSHLLDLLNADRRVRIAQDFGAGPGVIYFQGYPQVPSINWTEAGQTVTCLCIDEGQEILRTSEAAQVLGRRMRYDPTDEWREGAPDDTLTTALPAAFNAGNRPNRSAEAYPFSVNGTTHPVHLFVEDDAPEAEFWSFAEALRYVLFFHVLRPGLKVSVREFLEDTRDLIDLREPASGSGDPFVRAITGRVEDVSVNSMDAERAVHVLVDAAGLHYEVGLRIDRGKFGSRGATTDAEYVLRIFAIVGSGEEAERTPRRAMIAPRVHTVPREAPFTDMEGRSPLAIITANKATSGSLTIDRRAINAPIILGGHRHYEVWLLLRPGWLPHTQLDNLNTDEEQKTAIDFWFNEFDPEFVTPDDPDDKTRIPNSVYHGAHPLHYTVKDVARLWFFPDDQRRIGDHHGFLP